MRDIALPAAGAAPQHWSMPTTDSKPRTADRIRAIWPGLLVCAAVGILSTVVAQFIPGISGLLIAIVVGILWRNLLPYPKVLSGGTAIVAKPILRFGIVLLGLQLSMGDILALGGWGVLAVIAAVGITFWLTMLVGRWLRIGLDQRILIASGFSICGAAAVAGAKSVTDADEEETATALALVVVFGTVMIPAMPALAALLGATPEQTGMLIGLTTHEVAQVVAAGGIVGGGALAVAVTVKLARVLLLAPIMIGLSAARRRKVGESGSGSRPPLVPLFIIGFVACVALRSLGVLPEPVLDVTQVVQTVALSTAMFALGLNVHIKSLIKVGGRPVVLAAVSTAVIVLVGIAAVFVPGLLGFDAI
ncbi:Putative membrane protein YeiH [Gulosibacter sp. 10]|nr:Putative membrane protein YeiH [Gulosibacter sp. 10]